MIMTHIMQGLAYDFDTEPPNPSKYVVVTCPNTECPNYMKFLRKAVKP
jgi:hypothetical protein